MVTLHSGSGHMIAPAIPAYPVMGRKAVALREGRAFALWSYAVATCQGQKSSDLDESTLRDLFDCSSRSLWRWLKQARRLGYLHSYYRMESGWRVYFVSQKRIHASLSHRAAAAGIADSGEVDQRRVLIPLKSWAALAHFNAALFDAWVSIRKKSSRTIPQGAITAGWNRSKQARHAWPTQAIVINNYGAADHEPELGPQSPAPAIDYLLSLPPGDLPNSFAGSYRGRAFTYYRRPNSYTMLCADKARRGQARKFQKSNACDLRGAGRLSSFDTDGPIPDTHPAKRNFTALDEFRDTRVSQRTARLYYRVSAIRRAARWSQIWQLSPRFLAASE